MKRIDIINSIGRKWLVSNVENDEFSYKKAYKDKGLTFSPIDYGKKSKAEILDLRFHKNGVSVLIETKADFSKEPTAEPQLSAYVKYEKGLFPENKIIAILANTDNDDIKTWVHYVSDETVDYKHTVIISIDEYEDIFQPKVNNKEKVLQNTYNLNKELDKAGVKESIRSQFVGTCLLALKNGLKHDSPDKETEDILNAIRRKLEGLLEDNIQKAKKISLLDTKVLEDQAVRKMDVATLRKILTDIETGILPFINDRITAGEDLLNLFFTTFNKYVYREDKNQAFTPDHICEFMTEITDVNSNTRVLDPTCGSGSFLVRAMTKELNEAESKDKAEIVKKEHIYGIEYSEDVFGLATTNMLLHSDGNSNVVLDNCFNRENWIINEAKPTVVLMNPPYNGSKNVFPKEYTRQWGSNDTRDPSKGFYFVNYIAEAVNKIGGKNNEHISKMAVLLPVACAIGTDSIIKDYKRLMLTHNTLDAVFSLPSDVFYPGASAVACCMLFTLGKPHFDSIQEVEIYKKNGELKEIKYIPGKPRKSTFFGFCREDGFKKKKNLGRVEQMDKATGESRWQEIRKKWLDLYRDNKEEIGYSAVRRVSWEDEWLCEAYMETDYGRLSELDFQKTINGYCSYLVNAGKYPVLQPQKGNALDFNTHEWKEFRVGDFFDIHPTKAIDGLSSKDCVESGTPLITNSAENNGIVGFCDFPPTEEGNIITFSDTTVGNTFFFQPYPFVGFAHVQGMYPITRKWNIAELLFFKTLLVFECSVKYNYGRKMRRDLVSNISLKLPVSPDGEPDWKFMENYIKSLPYGDRI